MPNPHPLIVHFPIALFLVAVICEIVAYFRRSDLLAKTSLVTSVISTLGAALAVLTGLPAEPLIPRSGAVRAVFESHETMGYLVLVTSFLFAAMKVYSYVRKTDRWLVPQIAVGLLGIVVTIFAAHEGGELVYRHGVGVQAPSALESPATPRDNAMSRALYPTPADSARDSTAAQPR